MPSDAGTYTGRFAPSPTGPLHFGSLLAAVASYLQAKSSNGRWLLRIEDIDPPREQRGAADAIIAALEKYGFEWDGPVRYQRQNIPHHRQIVEGLLKEGRAYYCVCTRQDLARAPRGAMGRIYPGTCRSGNRSKNGAVRVRTDDHAVRFGDLLQGPQAQRLESESGDFVIKRRDCLIAYHLAVVVDDFEQGVSQVVRGVDLLDSTPRQIYLQRLLGYRTPEYAHIPVVVNASGQKLGKTTGARALPTDQPAQTLASALRALQQNPPEELAVASLSEVWEWASQHWTLPPLMHRRSVPEPVQPYG
jgi:glutamyl-Q tRNA(Asp) synthetase